MKTTNRLFLMPVAVLAGVLAAGSTLRAADAPASPPAKLVRAKAYHVLPQTHNGSGYYSLCAGLDGSVYVGTANYGVNSYLVEFDPRTETQRIVIDTHKVCGLNAKGFAAQAKIHTRNFVGPSGRIYCGSKEGYRLGKEDTAEYPGGYLMTYDPRTGLAENLGMPMKGQGLIDVTADEARGLMYVVACEENHWMLYRQSERKGVPNPDSSGLGAPYRELGPILASRAATLVDASGRASAITGDGRLAQYDPATDKVTVRPIEVDGKPFAPGKSFIPVWILSADARKAYLVLRADPTLIQIDLLEQGAAAKAHSYGRMIEGKAFECKAAMAMSPDGRVYAFIFADGRSHLARFDPKTGRSEDLGVVVVENPDFLKGLSGTHGFAKLPDGSGPSALSPLYHYGLTVSLDGTIYATAIYPLTLLRIDAFKLPPPAGKSAAREYIEAVLTHCDALEKQLPEGGAKGDESRRGPQSRLETSFTTVAEVVADRHIAGGLLGVHGNGAGLAPELHGRAGGIVHVGFDRPFKTDRTDAEKAKDVMLAAWDRAPGPSEPSAIEAAKKRGVYVIGFGPRQMPEMAKIVALCDAFFDTGTGADDRVVLLGNGQHAGRANGTYNALAGWVFTAELVAALTRRGKMPTMWKSYLYDDAREYGARYLGKKQFHDEFKIAPIAPGELGRQYLERARYHLRRLEYAETPELEKAAEMIAQEFKQGRKTLVLTEGHMPSAYVGKAEDSTWASPMDVNAQLDDQMEQYKARSPEGALVLRLGYFGLKDNLRQVVDARKQRLMLITSSDYPQPGWQAGPNTPVNIDLGCAMGDACVTIEGYPLRVFPISGVMQAAAYEAINAQVFQGLAAK